MSYKEIWLTALTAIGITAIVITLMAIAERIGF